MKSWHNTKEMTETQRATFKQIMKDEIKNIERFQEELERKHNI